jgi:hypothetical protein
LLETLAKWVEGNKINVANGGFGNDLTNEFGLGYVGCGISRWVYKSKGTRKVYKITNQVAHNISEYAFYHGLKGTALQAIFAKCFSISKNGMVLEQEYCPKKLPKTTTESWFNIDHALRDCLNFLTQVSREKRICYDFHTENVRMNSNYEAKIIDYSPLLWPMPLEHNFHLSRCISKLNSKAKKNDRKIKFFMNQQRKVVLDTGKEIYVSEHGK